MSYDTAADERLAALDPRGFRNAADFAATQLDKIGFTYTDLQPGDSTGYKIAIVRPPTVEQWGRTVRRHLSDEFPALARPEFNTENRYWVAHSFGPLYGWSGHEVHWRYVLEKWVCNPTSTTAPWTARIIARFLNELAEAIQARNEMG